MAPAQALSSLLSNNQQSRLVLLWLHWRFCGQGSQKQAQRSRALAGLATGIVSPRQEQGIVGLRRLQPLLLAAPGTICMVCPESPEVLEVGQVFSSRFEDLFSVRQLLDLAL